MEPEEDVEAPPLDTKSRGERRRERHREREEQKEMEVGQDETLVDEEELRRRKKERRRARRKAKQQKKEEEVAQESMPDDVPSQELQEIEAPPIQESQLPSGGQEPTLSGDVGETEQERRRKKKERRQRRRMRKQKKMEETTTEALEAPIPRAKEGEEVPTVDGQPTLPVKKQRRRRRKHRERKQRDRLETVDMEEAVEKTSEEKEDGSSDVKEQKEEEEKESTEEEKENAPEEASSWNKDQLFVGRQLEEFEGHVLGVTIERAESLVSGSEMTRPAVQVHVCREERGGYLSYLPKSNPNRPVVTRHEEGVEHVLPNETQPFDFRGKRSFTPLWQEELMFCDDYLHFVQPKVILLFEVLDTTLDLSNPTGRRRAAWGFLRLVNKHGQANTEKKMRLQLYEYTHGDDRLTNVTVKRPETVNQAYYRLYNGMRGGRVKYPSSLFITVRARPAPKPRTLRPGERPTLPVHEERGVMIHALAAGRDLPDQEEAIQVHEPLEGEEGVRGAWRRMSGQQCRIPELELYSLDPGKGGCSMVSFSPDGEWLVAACSLGNRQFPLKLFSVRTGKLEMTMEGHHDLVYNCTWSPNGTEFATASSDNTVKVRVWKRNKTTTQVFGISSPMSKHPLLQLQHTSYVYAVRWHPTATNPSVLVTAGYDHVIRCWNRDTCEVLRSLPGHTSYVNDIAFDPEGHRMFSGDGMGVIKVWTNQTSGEELDYECMKTVHTRALKGKPIITLQVHPNGRRLLVQAQDNAIRMMELRQYSIVQEYHGLENSHVWIKCAYSPCGRFVASGSEDGTVFVWNTEAGTTEHHYCNLGYPGAVTCINWHPHDHMLAFCSFGARQPVLVYRWSGEKEQQAGTEDGEQDARRQDLMALLGEVV